MYFAYFRHIFRILLAIGLLYFSIFHIFRWIPTFIFTRRRTCSAEEQEDVWLRRSWTI